MIIYVNGSTVSVEDSSSLQNFVEQHFATHNGMAVAIDENIIQKSKWSNHFLSDQQHLTIIKATQGG